MVPPSRINNSISDEQNEQRTTATNSEIDYVPQFDRLSIPSEIKMPKWVWYNVYRLLRDAPNQRLSQHELNVEHSKRFKQSIGGKTMLAACSVKKIVELLCALPYIEPVKVNGVMKYQLRPLDSGNKALNYRDKLDLMESKSKKVKDSSSDEEDFEPEIKLDIHDKDQKNAEDDFSLPCQPLELLPSWGVMPEALRQKIYTLLTTRKFREGVELKQFRDEYTKFYSSSISNQRDCKMNADQMFYCLKDIIEIVLTLKEINHDSPSTSSSAFKFDKCRPPPAQKPAEPFISPFLITPGQNKPQMLERGSACERTFQPENSRLQQNRSSEGEPVKAPESAVTFQNIITMKVPSPDSGNNCAVGFSSAGVRTGVNTKALGHYLQGIERSNKKKVSKVKSENFYESNTSHFYAERNESLETPSSKHQQYSIEPKDVFQKIREILNSYKDQWIKINDIFNIYARIEGSPLTFSLNEGHDLHEALEKRPESFAFNKYFDVKSRPSPKLPIRDVNSLSDSFTDFGIAQGDIYVKLFPELQLIKDEELQITANFKNFTLFAAFGGSSCLAVYQKVRLIMISEFYATGHRPHDHVHGVQVLVSHFEDNGDLYVQMSRMEQAFCDLEIDMKKVRLLLETDIKASLQERPTFETSSFYNNPFQNETYIMKDEMMRVGIPVAVCSGQSWRRARIVNIRGDSVFVQQVDFGSTIEVRKQDIRYLKSTFVTNAVAPCAILCSLYNVQHDFRDRDSVNSFIQEFLSDAARIIATVVDKRPIDNVPFIKLDVYSYDLNAPVNLNQEIDRRYTFDHAPSKRNSTPQTLMNDLNADLACWTTSAAQDIKNSNYFTESESSSVSPVDANVNAFQWAQNPLIDLTRDILFDVQGQLCTSSASTNIAADPAVQDIFETLFRKLNDPNIPESEKDTYRQLLQTFLPQR